VGGGGAYARSKKEKGQTSTINVETHFRDIKKEEERKQNNKGKGKKQGGRKGNKKSGENGQGRPLSTPVSKETTWERRNRWGGRGEIK